MSDCTSRRRSPSTRYVASIQSRRRTRSSSVRSRTRTSGLTPVWRRVSLARLRPMPKMEVRAIPNPFSRGRSTPTRRAIWARAPSVYGGRPRHRPDQPGSGPGLRAGGSPPRRSWCALCCGLLDAAREGPSALALLVTQVFADHHDPPVTADHLALVADLLDARLDLHGLRFSYLYR